MNIKLKKLFFYLVLLLTFIIPINIKAYDTELQITAINIGVQGDAMLLNSKGHYLLIDSGLNTPDNLLNYLRTQNIDSLDIYLSHWHNDHYGNMSAVMDNFNVGKFYIPKIEDSEDISWRLSAYNSLTEKARSKNIEIIELKKGDHFSFGDVDVDIIGPIGTYSVSQFPSDGGGNNYGHFLNNLSLIAKFKVGNTTFLSAGDTEKEEEAALVNSGVDLSADIMKLSHHAGWTSNTQEFMSKVNPKYTFCQVGAENNAFNASWTKEVVNRVNESTNVLASSYNGNVTYNIKNDKITITAEKNYKDITLHYIDTSTNQELGTEVLPFYINSKYHIFDLNNKFDTYTYVNADDNLEGVITENKDIKVFYNKIQYKLTINYVDQNNSKIADRLVETLDKGSTYNLNDYIIDIEGYRFNHFDGNKTGVINGNMNINLYYDKAIFINVADTKSSIIIGIIIGIILILIGMKLLVISKKDAI